MTGSMGLSGHSSSSSPATPSTAAAGASSAPGSSSSSQIHSLSSGIAAASLSGNVAVHYVLMRVDSPTPLLQSPNWTELDLNQTDTQYLFAKLQWAARQLAATLNPSSAAAHAPSQQAAVQSSTPSTPSSSSSSSSLFIPRSNGSSSPMPYTQAIHMRGQKHVFSYYALGEFCLILHREEGGPPPGSAGGMNASDEWLLNADPLSSAGSHTMICNDGSLDFDKEAQVRSVLQQLSALLNLDSEASGSLSASLNTSSAPSSTTQTVPGS